MPFSRGPGGGQFAVTCTGVTARSGHHAKLARGQPRMCWTGFITVSRHWIFDPALNLGTAAAEFERQSIASIIYSNCRRRGAKRIAEKAAVTESTSTLPSCRNQRHHFRSSAGGHSYRRDKSERFLASAIKPAFLNTRFSRDHLDPRGTIMDRQSINANLDSQVISS